VNRTLQKVLGYVGAAVFMLAFWEGMSLLLHSPALPVPLDAFAQVVEQFGKLLPHFGYSVLRVVAAWGSGLSRERRSD